MKISNYHIKFSSPPRSKGERGGYEHTIPTPRSPQQQTLETRDIFEKLALLVGEVQMSVFRFQRKGDRQKRRW